MLPLHETQADFPVAKPTHGESVILVKRHLRSHVQSSAHVDRLRLGAVNVCERTLRTLQTSVTHLHLIPIQHTLYLAGNAD